MHSPTNTLATVASVCTLRWVSIHSFKISQSNSSCLLLLFGVFGWHCCCYYSIFSTTFKRPTHRTAITYALLLNFIWSWWDLLVDWHQAIINSVDIVWFCFMFSAPWGFFVFVYYVGTSSKTQWMEWNVNKNIWLRQKIENKVKIKKIVSEKYISCVIFYVGGRKRRPNTNHAEVYTTHIYASRLCAIRECLSGVGIIHTKTTKNAPKKNEEKHRSLENVFFFFLIINTV